MRLPRWVFSPLLVAVTAVVLHAEGMTYGLLRQEWDISGFVFLGQQMPWASDPAFDAVTRRFSASGYDGQAYFVIAQAPFGNHRGQMDFPVRQTRILYPLACYLASGGDGRVLLWAMPLVNLFAIGVMTWLAAVYARSWDRSVWCGLLFPFMVNAMVPAVRNLTDAFAFTAVMALVLAWERRSSALILGLTATASLLSREQNLAVVMVVVVLAIRERKWWAVSALLTATAILFGWMLYLKNLYGEWPVMPTEGNLAAPLVGIQHWYHFPSRNPQEWLLRVVHAVFLIGCALILLWRLIRDRTLTLGAIVGWGGVALTLLAGPAITDDYWGYSRALFWLPLGAWAASVRAGCWPALVFGILSLAFLRGTLNVL